MAQELDDNSPVGDPEVIKRLTELNVLDRFATQSKLVNIATSSITENPIVNAHLHRFRF